MGRQHEESEASVTRTPESQKAPARGMARGTAGLPGPAPGGVGVLILTGDGRAIVEANDAAARLLGYTVAELRGLGVDGLFDAGPSQTAWRAGAGTATMRHKNGHAIPCHVTLGALPVGGEARLVVTISRTPDSQRKSRLDALLRVAIENLPEALIIYDENDRLLYFNQAYQRMFPYMPPFEEMEGCHFFELIQHSMDTPGVVLDPLCKRDPDAYRQKRLQRIRNPRSEPFEQETAGRWHLVHEKRVPGVGFVSVRRDITEDKRLRDEVSEREALFRTVVETAPVALMLTRISDQRLVMINQRAADLFALPETEPEGLSAADLCAEPDGWSDLLACVHRDETFHERELCFRKADGTRFWGLTSGSRTSFRGEPVMLLGVVDISARREHEREMAAANARLEELAGRLEQARKDAERARMDAEHANRSKSEFLAMMSHELRTPLNAVLGFSSVLDQELFGPPGNDKYAEYARLIHDSGAHLLAIINDILDLAKVEAGRMDIDPARIDMRDIAGECTTLVRGLAEKHGVRVAVNVEDPARPLHADRRMTKQMIVNLLSNACKFAPAGSTVELRCANAPDGGTRVSITDTGPGMNEGEIAIALEPFRQVGDVTTNSRSGTGLGLPLVKSFIEMHGGRLDIQSTPGEGTRATLYFPPAPEAAGRNEP